MEHVNIRPANNNDLDSLVQVMEHLIQYSKSKLTDAYLDSLQIDRRTSIQPWFEKIMGNPKRAVYIADDGGKVAGFVVGNLSKPFGGALTDYVIGRIETCWVEPDYRHTGCGRALIAKIESWLKAQGVKHVDVYYLKDNAEAERAWHHLGFESYRIAARKKL